MYPVIVSGEPERRYLSASGVLTYSPSRFSSSPSETHASRRRVNSLQSAGRLPSKMPSSTAANIVFERRKAWIRSRTIPEVVISSWLQALAGELYAAGLAVHDCADSNAGDAGFGRRGVEQLVIFAIVQRLLESCAIEQWNGFQLGGNAGCEAEAVQIEREAVADVHARSRFPNQLTANIQSRRDDRLMTPAAQRPRNINGIA